MRLDSYLAEKNMTNSRSRAKEAIEKGTVKVNGKRVTKSSYMVREADDVEIEHDVCSWVSRAGSKLEHAFVTWNLDVEGMICLDVGASTGGFTEVLLSHGARKVYSVDVGHEQLHQKLKQDARVISMEGMNIKDISSKEITELVGCVVVDTSFISLLKVLPPALLFLQEKGIVVALIKPQFEVGKEHIKKGIVTDVSLHEDVVKRVREHVALLGLSVVGTIESPVRGGDGNTEFLLYACKNTV